MTDLMRSDEIKSLVRDAYRDVTGGGREAVEAIYGADLLQGVPDAAVERSLGVANHMPHADLREGETVLDIGCGAGIDCVIAGRKVGPTGRVIGLDFLPEMLERARKTFAEAGLTNCETLEGEMEAIPLPDASVDAVISNGVINLSPRKTRVFAEIFRVLRPGGRMCVSDLTIVEEELPPEVLVHPAAWAG